MSLTGAFVVAVMLFTLPGFIISWVAGAKAPAAAASAMPVTFGVMGMSAWMWGETTAPFNTLTFTISLMFTLGCAVLWRWAMDRRLRTASTWRERFLPEGWRAGSVADPAWVVPAIGVIGGAWMIVGDRLNWLARVPHGTDNIVQGWDVQWHANVVRFIREEGIASPTRMGELQNIETQAQLLYPTGYHSGIALFAQVAGLEPIPALNIAAAILPGLTLPLTMACLALAVTQSRGLTAQIAAALAALACYVAPTLMWIPDYVGMWPYLFAVTLTGIVIWQFCSTPARPAMALPAMLGFVGVLVVHPSAVTIVAVAVALFWLTRLLFVPVTTRLKDLLWIAGPAVVGALLFLPQILQGSSQAEEVAAWGIAEGDITPTPWKTILMMQTRHSVQFFHDFDATVLLWLAVFGAIVVVVWRRQVWPVLFFGISAMAAVHVLEPFDSVVGTALSAITNLHYNTAHRLVMPVSMLTIVGAAIGVAAAIRLLTLAPLAARKGSPRWRWVSISASLVVALIVGAGTVAWARDTSELGAQGAYTGARMNMRMVSVNDRIAFDWLATQPAAWEGLTYGEPDDGHSWIYAYNGVPTLSRHYLWPTGGRGSMMDRIHYHTDALGEGLRGDPGSENPVDEAAIELGVKFIISSPDNFWWHVVPRYEQLKGLWVAEGATPVYARGNTVIFAVNDAFTPAELRAMARDAREHGSEEIPQLEPIGAAGAG